MGTVGSWMCETFEAVITRFVGILFMSETVTAIPILGTGTVLGSIVAIGLAESSAEARNKSTSDKHPYSHSGTVLDLPIS